MATATANPPPVTASPQPYRWTLQQFHDLNERGAFHPMRPMLVRGVILVKPVNPPHATSAVLAEEALRAAFGRGHFVRPSLPLVLGRDTDPYPDLAVVPGGPRDYAAAHPTTALLVVEVSDTTLTYDTGEKASLYAASGINDYWVIDVNGRGLIVHRQPVPDPTAPFGARYAAVTPLAPGAAVAPLAMPASAIAVNDLLP
jgi:Uma2 family endonuclease